MNRLFLYFETSPSLYPVFLPSWKNVPVFLFLDLHPVFLFLAIQFYKEKEERKKNCYMTGMLLLWFYSVSKSNIIFGKKQTGKQTYLLL